MEPKAVKQEAMIKSDRGPMEGMILVNGRPQMEPSDIPCISFDSPETVQQFCKIMNSTGETVPGK